MKHYSTILGDLLSPLNRSDFAKTVKAYKGDYRARTVKADNILRTGVFAQASGCKGMRDIIESMQASKSKLYHCGLKEIKLSTFSDALARIDHRIFQKTFYNLASYARHIAGEANKRFKYPCKALDATIIEACLEKLGWAKYTKTKGAVKLHTKIDNDNLFPEQVIITNGKVHEVKTMKKMTREKGVIYVMDRAYIDFKSLYNIQLGHSYFVTRMKTNCAYEIVKTNYESQNGPVRLDAEIKLTGKKTKDYYPATIRMVVYHDDELDRDFTFITNSKELSAQEVADVYKSRWQIELFFKWLKQNLKIKSFWGTSKNAVFIQIWIALITALLLWIKRKLMTVDISAHKILQRICHNMLEKKTIDDLLFPPKPPPQQALPMPLWGDLCV
jgi:hypothetical protein